MTIEKNKTVLLEDETLRDGLQMESRIFSLAEKLSIFNLIKKAGFRQIQVGSFVHPKIIPQMADTDELIRVIGKQVDLVVSVLVLNETGLERALNCGVSHANMSVSISDTHNRKNTRRPASEALSSMTGLIRQAVDAGMLVRGGLQCVFGCVYEGPVSVSVVLSAVEKMLMAGAETINLADTTGMADPYSIRQMIEVCQTKFPGIDISLHLHNTRGLGLANMFSGYEAGVRSFDVCTGGLGGCPFVTGAAGNVSAEDAVNMFHSMGIETNIDLAAVCNTTAFLETVLERKLPGHMKHVFDSCQK